MVQQATSSGSKMTSATQGQMQFAELSDPEDGEASKKRKKAAGQSGVRYQVAERYACLMTGKEKFKDISILSKVADAVHVGADDWLNVIACAPEKQLSFICPQQAMKLE